ncbi:amidohydrolase [Planosporangium thailandense]|uniref:Amidohydrolase n=1 Tax=Planosporangium thailandense TaxID=765197 RepID=A0ABX0XZH9_9ACTN|nr:amidohydrolase [Planosporangium thailandense]NJC70564.1 amidohydrolase [Planosporangium thailandense]
MTVNPAEPAPTATRTAFVGGLVWTHGTGPIAADVLVANGRIVHVGALSADQLETASEVVDLAGGTLLPGFGDGHAHPPFGGLEPQFADVRQDSIEGIVRSVGRYAEANPGLDWIQGWGFDLSLAPAGRFDARWLDEAVPDRPVVLRASDYHTAWCNSEALRRAGITAATPQPQDGEIVLREDGSPLGTLREWGATNLVFDLLPELEHEQVVLALDDATRRFAEAGVTWVQDAWTEPDTVGAYLAAARRGALHTRLNMAFRADPATWRDQVKTFVDRRAEVESAGHDLLTARTVKFFADGVLESGTASLLEPYCDCPHSHGVPNWSADELTAAVTAFDALGFQTHIHAIGDAAVRDALDAIAAATATNPRWDRRPVLAHVQVVHPRDLPRFAELGVIACFQPLWAKLGPVQRALTIPRLGPERSRLQYPIGGIVRSGAPISFGSDWPVTDLNPLVGLTTAVTRQTAAGEPAGGWLPEERLDLPHAVAAYTKGSAYQAFLDDTGAIQVGNRADLCWVMADLREPDLAKLPHARVLGTWVDGRRTR